MKEGVDGVWVVSNIKPRNYTMVLLGRSGVSVRVLRVFCFLSHCHLGGSCWGGRTLWSSHVGDGETITFLTWDWNDFVGLFFEVWKSFVCKNFSILDSYCVVGRITKEFPLSAFAIIAPFSVSFVFMFLMALGSNCKFRVCDGVLFFCSVLMRSAVSFLHISHSGGRRREMAVSASRARF